MWDVYGIGTSGLVLFVGLGVSRYRAWRDLQDWQEGEPIREQRGQRSGFVGTIMVLGVATLSEDGSWWPQFSSMGLE